MRTPIERIRDKYALDDKLLDEFKQIWLSEFRDGVEFKAWERAEERLLAKYPKLMRNVARTNY